MSLFKFGTVNLKSFVQLLLALLVLNCANAPFALAAKSELLDVKSAQLTSAHPNVGKGATTVKIQLFILDIDTIDDANQRFNIDMFVTVSWLDKRLEVPKRKREGVARTLALESIWAPRGIIVNDRGLSRNLPQVAKVDDLGRVEVTQRLTGQLSADFDFRAFPLDRQFLPIDIVAYAHSKNEINFDLSLLVSDAEGDFSVQGWSLTTLDPKASEFFVPGMKSARPRATFVIGAQRDVGYYIFTMFLPMTLIILMAWSVFWLPPDIIPARVSISSAAIFSFVAFGFSVRSNLPDVSYMTRADMFVTGCTLLVFIALGVAVTGSRLANSGRMEVALRLSALARWLYLVLFVGVAAIAWLF